MDFFAGSATTGQAVIEDNIENNSNKQFVLITDNQNDICDNVSQMRIKNIISGYNDIDENKIPGVNQNFSYLKYKG
jgi:adenine-specific DNA-methyltransferase